jgi:hypothetical protein
MLRVNGILPSVDECRNENKSAFIKGYHDAGSHLHNLADTYPSSKVRLFNREIDDDTMEVLQLIINSGRTETGSPYSNIEIFCCRDIDKRLDLKSLEQNPILKNIKIYRHPQKDIFHDRFLSVFVEEEQFEDIYLMGNSLSSIKNKPMSIAQILGKCIVNLYEHTQSGLKKELKEIVDKSKRIYPKVEL